jgi:hypothetical protein
MKNILGGIHMQGNVIFDKGTSISCRNNTRLDVSFKSLIVDTISEALEVSEHDLALLLTSSNEEDRTYAQAIHTLKQKINNG